jgi:hypothetical protein
MFVGPESQKHPSKKNHRKSKEKDTNIEKMLQIHKGKKHVTCGEHGSLIIQKHENGIEW